MDYFDVITANERLKDRSRAAERDRLLRAYLLYCRIAALIFLITTVYPVTTKLIQERLHHDWLHSVLHLCSGIVAAYAGWYARDIRLAKMFTWGIGLLYFALGSYGWLTPGLLLHTPFAIPLGIGDNVFHLILSMPALVIAGLDLQGGKDGRLVPRERSRG